MRHLYVSDLDGRTETVVVEDHKLVEYYVEPAQKCQLAGSVCLGKVTDVLPGLQAAFVRIGLEKNAYLSLDDLLPPHPDRQPKPKPRIEQLVKPGDELIVQIVKEPIGTKGAKVTTNLSFPGRWLVYMPDAGYTAVSRKISSPEEHRRLVDIGDQIREPDEGLIFRTLADGQSEWAFREDLDRLRRQWRDIRRKSEQAEAPAWLYRERDAADRVVRDLFASAEDRLTVNSKERAATWREWAKRMQPGMERGIELVEPGVDLLEMAGLRRELDRLMRPKVWLDCGGYLVVDRTEAMTVVDVNTGKFTAAADLEHAALAVNLEAAEMIARLMRLRDLGGIILVDFIDMEEESHRRQVADKLQTALRRDRTRVHALGWTRLGLMELTRKKVRETATDPARVYCSACGGSGLAATPPIFG
ncbi:Rne/Rng family ribonuclease [Paenibacillus thermoaerophilus]|uniref:Rne/Rng family ribonuclease n=1 Tax=Paenibacillus thermoaerophilus TaxID=1215385 RepID=A0ABW2V186_9BACL|nr:Rne/Rng family ribonuclease [Paenibacillus thermoaerophilus]TMV17288.1 Rne/Rng family ribonuclease [Paenibacillus thermoaerophilus]